jgi:hypothetical protein
MTTLIRCMKGSVSVGGVVPRNHSEVWSGFCSASRVWRRHPSHRHEPSGSGQRPGVRGRAQLKTLRPFGALPTGSSEPEGSPHVRQRRLLRSGGSSGHAARSFGVERRRPGEPVGREGRGGTGWCRRRALRSSTAVSCFREHVPRSSELGVDGAWGLFGGAERGRGLVLMSSEGCETSGELAWWSFGVARRTRCDVERSAGSRCNCLPRFFVLRGDEASLVAAMRSWGLEAGSRGNFGRLRMAEPSRGAGVIFGSPRGRRV